MSQKSEIYIIYVCVKQDVSNSVYVKMDHFEISQKSGIYQIYIYIAGCVLRVYVKMDSLLGKRCDLAQGILTRTLCNTLQQTATHCNTLLQDVSNSVYVKMDSLLGGRRGGAEI